MAKQNKPAKAKAGRKPQTFKIVGMTFEEAIAKSFEAKKPAGGWPKPVKKKTAKK